MSDANESARTESWGRRLAVAGDTAFFDGLYQAGRSEEVRGWGLEPAAAQTFLRQQADWQRRSYAMQFPAAEYWVLLARDEPVGRLILHEGPARVDEGAVLHIVDVQIAAAYRGRGLGGWALEKVLERGRATRRAVQLRVARENPARRLYERLGFQYVADDGASVDALDLLMRHPPP